MPADRLPRPTTSFVDRLAVVPFAVVLSAVVLTSPATAQESPTPPTPSDRLYALFEREWERTMRENPEWASTLGDRRWNDRWQDLSAEAIEVSHAADRRALEALLAIERASLPPAARLDHDLFRQELERAIEGYRFRGFEIPLNQRGGVQTADEIQESLRFTEVSDYEDWVGRLRRVGTLVDQTIALMEQGIASGRVPPRVIMERIPDQIAKQVVDDPEASPFWKAFEEMPEDLPAAERERLRREGRAAIAEVVLPAYRRFQSFFADRYLPATRESVGAWDLPDGEALYRFAARSFTTTDMTPEESPFWKAFAEMPEGLPAAERERLRREGRAAIAEVVLPAYRRFQRFFVDRYLPATRDTVGAWDLPDGEALYRFATRSFTTTDLTPEAIHEIGLAEVARIRSEMETIIEEVGFEGTFAEFLDHLRTDPKFYYEDPEELLEAYRATAKKIDPELVKLFGRLPRMPYGVKPIPDNVAPDTTTAYYSRPAADGSRAGYYYVNLYRPEVRPKYEIEVLTVHEAMPGHHLQLALSQELGELPAFRRFGGFTAFVEGWGLDSESLGDELGLYQDPYSKFGQLTYEMWRAVRLVVDTGIHAKKWSRQQAIDLFAANAAKTEHDIVNEIDRYIAWPGQALAYKIGELKIQELRRRAEERLGERFDVRGFHDAVLAQGGVPLDVLERQIDAWIAARLAAAPAAGAGLEDAAP